MDCLTVSRRLGLDLLGTEGMVLPLEAELHYSATDPLAVQACFDGGSAEPVRWVFGRDLLACGLHHRTGDGDVVVWPVRLRGSPPAIQLALRSPDGDALLEAPADEVQTFLAATYRVVPPGAERQHIDLDAVVSALLGEG